MSRDFKEIFDLARLRRAWGDASAEPAAPAESGDDFSRPAANQPVAAPSPNASGSSRAKPVSPQILLDQLADAVATEFPAHATALGYHLDILRSRLNALVGERGPSTHAPASPVELPAELAFAYHADVQENLDQLEDLIDALSLPTPSGD